MPVDTFTPDELTDAERADACRHGSRHVVEDPMHAGQPIHVEYRYLDGEPVYRLQITHRDMLLWYCESCQKVTVGEPDRCAGCGIDGDHHIGLSPLLYPTAVRCRSSGPEFGGPYEGACLLAGSDGCECLEVSA